jgi:L-cysteine desulfidase
MKNLLSEILKNEVYPALGCTEPISVAYACANASKLIKNLDPYRIKITLNIDPGTYKNGYGVNIPNLENEKGNLIAAALGTLIAKPNLKYKIFSKVDKTMIEEARKIINENRIRVNVDYTKKDIYIEAILENENDIATCIITRSHFEVSLLMLNGKIISSKKLEEKNSDYKEIIKNLSFAELVDLANNATEKELNYIKKGIDMNLKIAKKGFELKKIGYHLKMMKNFEKDSFILEIKSIAAAATDARMAGLPFPVMSSGQSGNQGVVTILLPYLIGKRKQIDEKTILKSIALSHIINSYIKSYTGELSPVCGCAISSAAASAAAIVYQKNPNDIEKIEGAVNNVIADIGGLICDGAKESCSLKVISSIDSAIKGSVLSENGIIMKSSNGFIGKNATETIKNMARISIIGMASVDSIIIETMQNKLKCTN